MHLHDLFFSSVYHYHIARYYIYALLMALPLARIFMRAGFKPYWVVLLAVPDVGLLLCVLTLALQKWKEKGVLA